MRYLKKLVLNRRIANDTSLYIDTEQQHFIMNAGTDITFNGGQNVFVNASKNIYMDNTKQSLVLPIGTTSQKPGQAGNVSPINGMIRYNSQTNEFEGYQSNKWRRFKFKEVSPITQQNLGAGDDATVYFGPLSTVYDPSNMSSSMPGSGDQSSGAYGGQNIFVVVENVIQIFGTNYTVEQNPTIEGESYTGIVSYSTNSGKTIYFNTSLTASTATGDGSTTTVNFDNTQAAPQFAVGATITVTGFKPMSLNGVFTVTYCNNTQVGYANTFSGTATQAGTVSATGVSAAVYPATNIVGATITGSVNIPNGTKVSSYTTDPITDALVSIVLNNNVTGTVSASTTLVIGEATRTINDGSYWLHFSSPVPTGKIVTVLLGFDQ